MRIRHKPPTLVSMWMLDVFCCALGCMILLWVLESLSSAEQTKKAKSALVDLSATRATLADMRKNLADTTAKLNAVVEDLRGQLAAVTADRDDAESRLLAANADAANTKKLLGIATSDIVDAKKKLAAASDDANSVRDELAKAESRAEALDDVMRKKDKAAVELTKRAAAVATAAGDLQKLLREKDQDLQALTAKSRDTDKQLSDLDAKYRALAKETADTKTTAADLAAARNAEATLKKEIADSRTQIIDLQGQKQKIADKFDRLKIDSDNKFAGIALTGKNVVFLIDISGSMRLKNDDVPDPDKWAGVVETVGKVMRSVPDLEQYQIVLFSEKASYPVGDGKWLPYKGEASVKDTLATLNKTVPNGGTNLYDGFDAAFKLRADGLDTIYLCSDGLPSLGDPLTPAQERELTGSKRTELLTRHLRNKMLEWNRPRDTKRVRINAIGFFYESPEVGAFLWSLAREHDGSFVGMSRP